MIARRRTSLYNFIVATTMTASEARAALPQILDRVLAGEEVTLTRHGKAVAVVVRPDMLRARRADEALAAAERVRELLERGRTSPLRARPALNKKQGEALAAEVRTARSSR
jgi:prevent-host-death family protein